MPVLSQHVAVKLADTWGGLARNSGILRLEEAALVLEYETCDDVLHVLKSDVKRCTLPLRDLESCSFHPGWLGANIELSVGSLELLRDVPGAAQGKLELRLARRDRLAASSLVASVNLALAHQVVRAAEEASEPTVRSPGEKPS
jgi:hypothetical protein